MVCGYQCPRSFWSLNHECDRDYSRYHSIPQRKMPSERRGDWMELAQNRSIRVEHISKILPSLFHRIIQPTSDHRPWYSTCRNDPFLHCTVYASCESRYYRDSSICALKTKCICCQSTELGGIPRTDYSNRWTTTGQ